jgi:hypothetical protein
MLRTVVVALSAALATQPPRQQRRPGGGGGDGVCRVSTASASWSEYGSRNAYTPDGAVHKFSACKGPWAWVSAANQSNITVDGCTRRANALSAREFLALHHPARWPGPTAWTTHGRAAATRKRPGCAPLIAPGYAGQVGCR